MRRARRRGLLHVMGVLSLCMLAGCGGSDGNGGSAGRGVSRLALQITLADASRNASSRTASHSTLRAVDEVDRITVKVTGSNIPSSAPVEADCPISGPPTDQCLEVNRVGSEITFKIVLEVPPGPSTLQVVVTAHDANDAVLFFGRSSVDVPQPGSEIDPIQVEITFNAVASASPTDLANRTFAFADGTAFGFAGQQINVEFGAFTDTMGSFTLTSGEQTASGTVIATSCIFMVTGGTLLPTNPTVTIDPCVVNADGSLTAVNAVTGDISISSPPNNAPVAQDDLRSTPENTRITIDVLTNDSDPNGDAFSIIAITQPPHGTAVDNGDGTIDYTPNVDFNGTDTFTYTIRDAGGLTATATVTVEVFFDPNAPVAQDDLRSTLENTRITIDVLTNDSDPNGDAFSIIAITQPPHGTAVDNGDGTIDYTPNVDFNGTDTFTYTIRDAGGLTVTATVTVEVFFDHFDIGFLDAMKWEDLEFVRMIQDGRLLLNIRRFGRFDPFDIGNRLVFANPTSFNSFQANVTVTQVDNADAFPAAFLTGSFYTSATGDVVGVIGIGHNGTDLVGFFAVLQCDDDLCEARRFLRLPETLGPATLGTTHTLSLAWDGAVFTFGFDGTERVFNPTTELVDPNGNPLAPVVSPTPGIPFHDLSTQVFGLPNGIPNVLLNPAQGGSITATFDDVMVNGSLFDDFASSLLDPTKWQTLEFVREVQNGRLVSSVRQSGPLLEEEEEENELEFQLPIGPTSFQAEVAVTEVTNAGTFPSAFLSGSFYNDGTGTAGDQGDVFAFIGIGHNGTALPVFFGVARCADEDCDTPTLLHFDTTTFGTVALNTLHTLLLTWDGTVFSFGFDGNTASFDPTSQAPVAGFPRDLFRSIGTRIGGPLNGFFTPLNPGEAGSITATFDNVQVFQRIPPVTTVTGQVVDESENLLAGVNVTTNGGRVGMTDTNGLFSIPDVPVGPDNIAASAAFTDPLTGTTFTGSSFEVLPGFGETDVGVITVVAPTQDTVILESTPFLIPAGMSSLRFEINFLSNEFPSFTGETNQFDDTAFALIRSDGVLVQTRVLTSVNVATFFPADRNVSGFNGQTGFQTIDFDVSSVAGSSVPVVLLINVRDAGDNIVDSALLLDNFRLEGTTTVQPIPNGGFESENFDNFTVIFERVADPLVPPMAAVLTSLGPIRPPQGNFMAFLSTGSEAADIINFIVPPGVVVTPHGE